MKALFIVPILAVLASGCDAPSKGAGASGATTGAPAPPTCAGLAEHWRTVWTAEPRPGMEMRARRAAELSVAAWARACAEAGVSSPPPADIEHIRGIRSLADLKAMDAASKGALAGPLKAAQGSVLKTEAAFAAAPASGVAECEYALADAAFCGDDVDRAAIKSAATGKDEGACTALGVLLTKKCAQQ